MTICYNSKNYLGSGICGGWSGTWTNYFLSALIFPSLSSHSCCVFIFVHLPSICWPDTGLSTKWTTTSKRNWNNWVYILPGIFILLTGYTAVRDPANGSPYIMCLCEELRSCGTQEDLLTILIRVHQRLSTAVYCLKDKNQLVKVQDKNHLDNARDKNQLVKVQDRNQLIKVQPSFLCYLNRFVRFDAPSFRPQTQ